MNILTIVLPYTANQARQFLIQYFSLNKAVFNWQSLDCVNLQRGNCQLVKIKSSFHGKSLALWITLIIKHPNPFILSIFLLLRPKSMQTPFCILILFMCTWQKEEFLCKSWDSASEETICSKCWHKCWNIFTDMTFSNLGDAKWTSFIYSWTARCPGS